MRIAWLLLALLGFNRNAGAADTTVYVTLDRAAGTFAAKRIAGSVFKQAGVTIVWRAPAQAATAAPPAWLRIELAEETPQERLPGALAVSYPYDGCSKGVTVFLDRVRSLARGDKQEAVQLQYMRESALLGYVLVHEITHVLEGMGRHSEAGLMKARWDAKDRAAILEGRLAFLDEDVRLIRRGLATRNCYAPAALIAQSQSGIAIHPE